MPAKFTLGGFEFFSRQTRVRIPFRYGIACMTEVPQQFVRVALDITPHPRPFSPLRGEGSRTSDTPSSGSQFSTHNSQLGLACEGLPPKWFTKDPNTTFESDLTDMRSVIEHAARVAQSIADNPITFFDWWRELTTAQAGWAKSQGFPPLLASLGVSLCERAVLDALCRSMGGPLHVLIRQNALRLRLGEIYPELGKAQPADFLPPTPLSRIHIRHTVGLGDPLTQSDIAAADRVDDGLPQDLESSIRAYGLRYFKIKLTGNTATDVPRLRGVAELCDRETGGDWFATLDGNENFKEFGAFRDFWQTLVGDPALRDLSRHVLVVEQPVHRSHALSDDARAVLADWKDRPPLIIDESDGSVGDVIRALELGYEGTSHKNCKGIVKGIANACLIEHRRRAGKRVVLTGEDLCNLGPVPLLQDLAMMALLGIEHVERNGHHYYRGLSPWPAEWQDKVQAAHPDLYTRHPQGFVCLDIRDGRISLDSVNAAPFGCAPLLQM